jgi:Zn-dependent protease
LVQTYADCIRQLGPCTEVLLRYDRGMFISLLQSDPRYYFAVVLVVIISICLHELAHGFSAIWLGDNTPEETGHITMNPLVHMGPFSLLMLAFVGISWGAMPVDPTRLRGKYADAIVSIAGPLTNLALAILAVLALGLWMRIAGGNILDLDHPNHMVQNGVLLLTVAGIFNLVLFALNLIPVPPLDGSHILASFVPAYRDLTRDPAMSGVFLAISFAVLITVGRYLFPVARDVFGKAVHLVGGAA